MSYHFAFKRAKIQKKEIDWIEEWKNLINVFYSYAKIPKFNCTFAPEN